VPETESFVLTDSLWVLNCQLRHKDAVGFYTSTHAKMHKEKALRGAAGGGVVLCRIPDPVSGQTVLAALGVPTVGEFKSLPPLDPDKALAFGDEFIATTRDGLAKVSIVDPDEFIGWEGSEAGFSAEGQIPHIHIEDEGLF
jgi:hypothetical protein